MEYALRIHYSCQTFVKTDDFEINHLFPAQPSLFSGTMENAIFAYLTKRSNYLNGDFCHIIASCSSFRKDQTSEAFY